MGNFTDQAVGAKIHQLIWRRKISQIEVGRWIAASQSTISNKLRGRYPFTPNELVTISRRLGVTVGDLFSELSVEDADADRASNQSDRARCVKFSHAANVRPMDELLTTREVTTLLKVSRTTLARYVQDGALNAYHLPSGRIRYATDEVRRLLAPKQVSA